MNLANAGGHTTVLVPGRGRFQISGEALRMVGIFGGSLRCYQGAGGCRTQGLYFSRTRPKKSITCLFESPAEGQKNLSITVSHELAAKLDGAVLDFGDYNKMQRFVWSVLPAVKCPRCTCLRSMGKPAGKRSPCLDDKGSGLVDL